MLTRADLFEAIEPLYQIIGAGVALFVIVFAVVLVIGPFIRKLRR